MLVFLGRDGGGVEGRGDERGVEWRVLREAFGKRIANMGGGLVAG